MPTPFAIFVRLQDQIGFRLFQCPLRPNIRKVKLTILVNENSFSDMHQTHILVNQSAIPAKMGTSLRH